MQRTPVDRNGAVRARLCSKLHRVGGASASACVETRECSTDGNLRGQIQYELGRTRLHRYGVQAVGWRYRLRRRTVDRDGTLADPARDAYIVRECLLSRDRRGERIAEGVQGVHRNRNLVICAT